MPDIRNLGSYESLGRALAPRLFRHFVIDPEGADMREVFARHPQLVLAFNHGPASGPVIVVAGYLYFIEQVGAHDRRHFGVTWRAFYDLPVLKHLARFITQTETVRTPAEYVEMLRSGEYNDFMVAPEGDHCNFGNGFDIQPFVSPGFIEIAVRAEVPVVVVSHQGSEAWSTEVALDAQAVQSLGRFIPTRWRNQLERTGLLSLPWFPFSQIDAFKMRFDLYLPRVTVAELDAADSRSARMALLQPEAEEVRRIMQLGVERLRTLDPTPADRVHPAGVRTRDEDVAGASSDTRGGADDTTEARDRPDP